MVNKVSFLGFRGGDHPNRPPAVSAPGRVLCDEHFIFEVTHSQVDVETEFGVVSLNLMFLILASIK